MSSPSEHPEGPKLRAKYAPALIGRVVRHPAWAMHSARQMLRQRSDAKAEFSLADFQELLVDEKTAVTNALGAEAAAGYDRARAAFWAPDPDPDEPRAFWDARQALQSLISVVVRLTKPEVMAETGVARGYSTAVTLAAMHDNGTGHLYSVDLPTVEFEADPGEMVPGGSRDRWTLELGPSTSVLPGLLNRVGPVDVFLADADHTYGGQREEYRTAWVGLRPGGILISDDVQNRAFMDAAAEFGAKPYLIGSPDREDAIGIMVKP